MITLIQLKQVARNRRFLFFTILFPALWYLMMAKLLNFPRASANYQLVLLVLAILIGILGNSIVTFSKRISSNRHFYFLQARTSQYSIWNYMGTQLSVQLILNLTITVILIISLPPADDSFQPRCLVILCPRQHVWCLPERDRFYLRD